LANADVIAINIAARDSGYRGQLQHCWFELVSARGLKVQ